VGAFIPADRIGSLQPGDLVFFGYNGDPDQIHHVGMYVGSGNFVHAPGTGDRVKVSSLLERIASRRDYVGAVRP
jgi:cell wall-associated NlpC family hydrolase